MKAFKIYFSIVAVLVLISCDKRINPELPDSDPFVSIDAWIDSRMQPQEIRVTQTTPYLDNTSIPVIPDAVVTLYNTTRNSEMLFDYSSETGSYVWDPNAIGNAIGTIGDQFMLEVVYEGITYTALTGLDPVPTIDSMTFEYYEADVFIDEDYYIGEFWAFDLPGEGNTYWIRSWKNGIELNRPAEINIAWDAAFSEGSVFDSAFFIQPIRTLMNPFEEEITEDYELTPAYAVGDTAYVEIHSISNEAWFYLTRIIDETNVEGGFGALFATPLANVPTNFSTSAEGVRVAGFFNVAQVSSRQETVNDETIRDNRPQ